MDTKPIDNGVAQAKDAAGRLSSEVHKATAAISEKVQHAGERAGEMATSAKSEIGGRLTGMASSVRSSEPWVVEKAERAADKLEDAGTYIRESDFASLAEDLTGFAKRHPLPLLAMAFGAGFLIAKSMPSAPDVV